MFPSGVRADQDSSGTYRWTSSRSPGPTVTYGWIDATDGTDIGFTTGNQVSSGLAPNYTRIPIGFSFNYYGSPNDSVDVSTEGFLSFGRLGGSFPANDTIPSTSVPNDVIAAYWGNLSLVTGASAVYYKTIGSAPNRQFVVSWTNFDWPGLAGAQLLTFQIILYETTNNIKIQYQSLSGVREIAGGDSVTIGIESGSGISTVGLCYNYNRTTSATDTLSNGFALLFHTNSLSSASASITPASLTTDVTSQQFVYTIRVTSPPDSMGRFDSVLV